MGILGGDAQANGQVTSSINFNPTIQFGTDLTSSARASASQTQRSEQSTSASASLPVGGMPSAGGFASSLGGLASGFLQHGENTGQAQVKKTTDKKIVDDKKKALLGLSAIGLGGMMLLKGKKKNGKRKS